MAGDRFLRRGTCGDHHPESGGVSAYIPLDTVLLFNARLSGPAWRVRWLMNR